MKNNEDAVVFEDLVEEDSRIKLTLVPPKVEKITDTIICPVCCELIESEYPQIPTCKKCGFFEFNWETDSTGSGEIFLDAWNSDVKEYQKKLDLIGVHYDK